MGNPARLVWLFLALAVVLGLRPSAQGVDPATLPSVERVLSEPGDDAEHYVRLKALSELAQRSGPGGQALFGAYYNALNDIDFRLRNGDAAAYEAFSVRVRELLAADASREAALGTSDGSAASEDELDRALAASVPYWIGALLVVLLASPLFVLLLDRRRLAGSPAASDGLPEELRNVRVLGRSYAVEVRTGLVVDKESRTEQRLHVSTSGGGVTVVGDQVWGTPVQVHAHTEITHKDCLWVRDAAGNESAWNFTNAALQARPGHTVSVVARPTPDGHAEFLLAFNHTTRQLDPFAGLARAHQARRLVPWLATTLLGAAAVLYVMRVLVLTDAQASGATLGFSALYQPSNWPMPLGLAGVVALLPVAIAAALLRSARTRAFLARQAPAFRRHFETRAHG